MDNRSNWLFWQVPPSIFISNCWDCRLQFFCSRRPCKQIWVGGWCCDREVLKGKGLWPQELAECRLMDFQDLYECQLPLWEDHVANFNSVHGITWVFGGLLRFPSMMLLLVREQTAKKHEMKRIFPPDSLSQNL